jgi:hypothetical protein
MSRSYRVRKFGDKNNSFFKKLSNKRVRHTKGIPNGKAYKKLLNSYDICDWKDPCFSFVVYQNRWYDIYSPEEIKQMWRKEASK